MASRPQKIPRDMPEGWLAFLMLLPAMALLGLIVVYPVGRLIYTSLFDLRLSAGSTEPIFIGIENYIFALTEDPQFWHATWNTIIIVLVTVPGSLLVGLGLALLANQPFRYRWPTRLALLLPWALPLVFAGLIFRWFFNTDYGIVNDVLNRLGLEGTSWLTRPNLAMACICLVIIWKSASFMAMILLAGLQTIPRALYEAAEVDGATRFQQFVKITLPMLVPSILVAMIFRTITAIQTFDIPYALTAGGPGNTTETLAMYIHKNTIDFLDFGYGSALAVLMFCVSMIATTAYLRFVKAGGSDER
ncbi:carbohydrate ABC transporter permease [Lacibacterium aquatile]|uniref:Carbohydrate ABC transporter permease n=1 Tax=Lacibacterium aquatile TaxID=1168082 RepID=A0ABW5DUI9_9PROT